MLFRKIIVCFLLACWLNTPILGQCFFANGYSSTAWPVRICQNRPITMNDAACISFSNINYRYGDNTAITTSKTHTYTQAGIYTVTLYGNVAGLGDSVKRSNYIQVLSTPKPKIQISRCNNRKLRVFVTQFAPYDRYKIDLGNAQTVYITPATNPLDYTYTTDGNYTVKVEGEYDLTAGNFCSGIAADTTLSNLSIYNAVGSISGVTVVSEGLASSCNGKIKISIAKIFKDFRYLIGYTINGGAFIPVRTFENQEENNFSTSIENLNTLGNTHQVSIRITDACNEISDNVTTLPATLSSLPLEVQKINASFDIENRLVVSWQSTGQAIEELRTYQISENGMFLDQTTNIQLGFASKNQKNSCYSVGFKSACGVQTLVSKPACPMILSVTAQNRESRTLTWTAYRNAQNEVVNSYEVIKLNSSNGAIDNFSVGSSLFYTDSKQDLENQVIKYRIRAVTASGDYFSDVVAITRPVSIFFPNVFTPNADGLNDVFFPKGLFIKTLRMEIFNQNGQQLFSSQALGQGWDGVFEGKIMPAGVYVYTCQIEDFIGNNNKLSGTFILQR